MGPIAPGHPNQNTMKSHKNRTLQRIYVTLYFIDCEVRDFLSYEIVAHFVKIWLFCLCLYIIHLFLTSRLVYGLKNRVSSTIVLFYKHISGSKFHIDFKISPYIGTNLNIKI